MSMQKTLGAFFNSRRERGAAGLPIMSVTLNDGMIYREELERRTETSLSPREHLLVRKDDIAYNMMRMWQGAFGLAEADCIVSPAYVVLNPKNGIDSRFAYHWFKSARMIHYFWAYSHGLTNDRLRLYFEDFCRIPAAPPPLEAQEQVAAVLDAWDLAIKTTERLLAAQRRRSAAALRRLIGDQQSARVGANMWCRAELADLAVFKSGGTPDRNNRSFWGGSIPWISAKDLKSFELLTSIDSITEEGAKSLNIVSEGSVLLLVRGMSLFKDIPLGIAIRPVAFNQDIKALVPKKDIQPRFLAYALRSRRHVLMDRVDRAGHGTGRLSTHFLETLPIAFPDKEEQARIVSVLHDLEREVLLTEKAVDALRRQKRGLMQKYLSGQFGAAEPRPPIGPAKLAIAGGCQ